MRDSQEITDQSLFSSISSNLSSAQGYEGQVLKLSKAKCCLNRRYLIVRQGAIKYYRESPHSLNLLSHSSEKHLQPKGQVSASICTIKQIHPNFIIRKHPFIFEISFDSPIKNKKHIIWAFAVLTQTQLDVWLKVLKQEQEADALNSLKDKESQKLLDEQVANELRQRMLREESKKKVSELEKRKAKIKEQQQEEHRRKLEVEFEVKRLQEEAEKKRQQEIERKRRERYAKLLEYSWDYQFQKLWGQSLQKNISYEDSLTFGIRIFKHLGVFRQKAVETCKIIVNELTLPEFSRRLLPISDSDSYKYVYQNMLIKLAPRSQKSTWKVLGHKFLGQKIMLDCLYKLCLSDSSFPIRIPLSCVVDYRGYRALVTAIAPLDGERTLINGPKADGIYIANTAMYDYLSLIAQRMKIKEHSFEWNEKIGPTYIHLSVFVELHKSLGYRELEEYVQGTLGEVGNDAFSVQENAYLLKLENIFPLDVKEIENIDFNKRLRPEFSNQYKKKLNLDCFIKVNKGEVNDAKSVIQASVDLENTAIPKLVKDLDQMVIIPIDALSLKAVLHSYGINLRYLGIIAREAKLPNIKEILSVEAIARSCKQILFEHISELNGDPSALDETLEANDPEQIKNRIFSASLNDFESKGLKRKTIKKVALVSNFNLNDMLFNSISPVNSSESEAKTAENILDFFNLVFGSGSESDLFWENIMIPLAVAKFNIEKRYIQKHLVNLNALLHSMCYHCAVFISFNEKTNLRTGNPFFMNNIKSIAYKTKTYEMNALEYTRLANKSIIYTKNQDFLLALQACELKLRISKASNPSNELGDPLILTEIAEILIETHDLENALKVAKEALVQLHPLNANSSRAWCVLTKAFFLKNLESEAIIAFNSAVAAINFHWSEMHPIHISLSCFLAEIYIKKDNLEAASEFYKSALVRALKVLGPNHVYTAHVYSDISKLCVIVGNSDDNLLYNEKAYNIYIATYGREAILTVSCGVLLADIFYKVGRYQEAEELVEHACAIYTNFMKRNKSLQRNQELSEIIEKFKTAASIGIKAAIKLIDHAKIAEYKGKIEKLRRFIKANKRE